MMRPDCNRFVKRQLDHRHRLVTILLGNFHREFVGALLEGDRRAGQRAGGEHLVGERIESEPSTGHS